MRRRTYGFLQVALGLLTTSLILPADLLAQHGGLLDVASPYGGSAPFLSIVLRISPQLCSTFGIVIPGPILTPSSLSTRTIRTLAIRRPRPSPIQMEWRGISWTVFLCRLPGVDPLRLRSSVRPGFGDDQDEGGGAPVAPQQPDYSNQPAGDYGPAAPEVAANTPSPFRPAYQGQIEAAPVHPQPSTTLIFKDGRSPVQVHNYALTDSTLYALDGDSRQEIPLSQLDVPATVEANRKAGIDFALPVSR